MAAAGFFCLMCGYYTLRPMREALALEVGVQYNSHPVLAVLVCSARAAAHLLVAGGAYAARPVAVDTCATPFVAGVPRAGTRVSLVSARNRTVAFVYFVALTSANLYLISVFWSAMADVWRPELAKRFYGYVAAGGSAGALLGPHRDVGLVRETGPAPLIVMACAFIMALGAVRDSRAPSLRRRAGRARSARCRDPGRRPRARRSPRGWCARPIYSASPA